MIFYREKRKRKKKTKAYAQAAGEASTQGVNADATDTCKSVTPSDHRERKPSSARLQRLVGGIKDHAAGPKISATPSLEGVSSCSSPTTITAMKGHKRGGRKRNQDSH